MDEAQWLTSEDPAAMLYYLRGSPPSQPVRASDRKLRLFACACCRAVWPRLTDPRSRRAVEVAESYADGGATEEQLGGSCRNWGPCESSGARAAEWAVTSFVASPVQQCSLLREVCGNPFRHLGDWYRPGDGIEPLPPKWLFPLLTPTVLALAQAAYEERQLPAGTLDNDRLAVLADALEDAGCDNEDILCHLRGDFVNRAGEKVIGAYRHLPHVRGCHVLDLLLGKE